jgi:glycerol kinase
MKHILAIDQSTSATKAVLFDAKGRVLDKASKAHRQIYPQPGWVEHDAEEIWKNVLAVIREIAARNPKIISKLAGLSIANQRETVVVFDRQTGRPLHNAIVWQCRRGTPICEKLQQQGHGAMIRRKTGLMVDTYFSASKLKWLVAEKPAIAAKLKSGEAVIGTIDTYLIHRFTGGKVFVTDFTNASRTMLFDIGKLRWDEQLCRLFDVPLRALPEARECSAHFGETDAAGILPKPIPIVGVMGDSQASLFAQHCYQPGTAKATFGTGTSVLLNIGGQLPGAHASGVPFSASRRKLCSPKFSEAEICDDESGATPDSARGTRALPGAVTALAWVWRGQPTYAFEGIINFSAATIEWLHNQLGMIQSASEVEKLALSVADNGGVYLVPAFAGLSAPYWAPGARAAIVGMSGFTKREHIVRAAQEAIAYQIRDVLDMMRADAKIALKTLQCDGGPTRNNFLMQFTADLTRTELKVSDVAESSALGAAMQGMLGLGLCQSLGELAKLPRKQKLFRPQMKAAEVKKLYDGWKQAVKRVL